MFDWMKRSQKTSTPRASAISRGPVTYVSNTIALIDTSYSVGQEMVDFAVNKGLPAIVESMRNASTRNGIVYNLGVMTFSSSVETVVPLMDVHELELGKYVGGLQAGGVTMMEDAMWQALGAIDKAKADQDRDGSIARAGSLIVVVTDGCPTDSDGCLSKLSSYLVRELADRNRTRSCETFAIGMGDVDDATLSQLGPKTLQKTQNGASVETAHAVCYLGDQSDIACWRTVYQLIGEASSSMTGKRAIAYTHDQSEWTRNVDAIRVDPSKFRIVA